MRDQAFGPFQLPEGFWVRTDVRQALTRRDIGALIRLLSKHGIGIPVFSITKVRLCINARFLSAEITVTIFDPSNRVTVRVAENKIKNIFRDDMTEQNTSIG